MEEENRWSGFGARRAVLRWNDFGVCVCVCVCGEEDEVMVVMDVVVEASRLIAVVWIAWRRCIVVLDVWWVLMGWMGYVVCNWNKDV